MARALGTNLLEALTAQETGRALIMLVTITHDDLSTPLRVSSDSVTTPSNGENFIAYPFQITLPDDPDDGFAAGKFIIDNVSRDIVKAIREIQSPPNVRIDLVMDDDPDTIYVTFDDFNFFH